MANILTDKKPIVYLVGAGPGDPQLITVRGLECVKRADIIIYDNLVSKLLLQHARPDAELLYVGKHSSDHSMTQEQINKLLVDKAATAKIIVRLKGGDPFIFGRGAEECEALIKANIPYEVVAGVTSGIAAASYAGIPLTHRLLSSSVAFVTGHEAASKQSSSINWKHIAEGADTIVVYMGVATLESIVSKLIEAGRKPTTPAAVIRWGTTPRQQTVVGTLETIVSLARESKIQSPAILVVGDVVLLRRTFNWYEKLPLFGKRIINTRAHHQANGLTMQLMQLGAQVLELPTIAIEYFNNNPDVERELERINQYEWLLFTSANGVHCFFDMLMSRFGDVRILGNLRIGCIGPATAEAVKMYHLRPAVTAKKAVAEGLIEELQPMGPWKGVRVLIARAADSRDILPATLTSWGACVSVLQLYRTVPPRNRDKEMLEIVASGNYDCICFCSSSAFINLLAMFTEQQRERFLLSARAVSIGPVTTSTMHKHSVLPICEAREHTIAGVVEAICGFFQGVGK